MPAIRCVVRRQPPLLSKQRGCVAAWHAGHLPGPHLTSDGKLRDIVSNTHHGQFGSTSGADSNDPLGLQPYLGKPHLYLPGSNGNYASVPDAAALDITGNLDVRCQAIAPDWSPSVTPVFGGKWRATGDQRSYRFRLNTNGKLILDRSTTGASGTIVSATSTAAVPFVDGAAGWVRAMWAAATGLVTFYTSTDGSSWTQLGDVVDSGSTTATFSGTGLVEVGASADGTSNPWPGSILNFQVFASLDGSDKRLDIDFTNAAAYNATRTSLVAVTGQTVTINRSTSGPKSVVVDRPLYSFGTDDYDEVANNADLNFGVSDSFTVAVAMRQYATPVSNGRFLAKQNGSAATAAGYSLTSDGTNLAPRATAGDGTTGLTATGPTFTAGAVHVIGMRRRAGRDLVAFTNGVLGTAVSDTLAATLSNTNPLRFGSRSDSAATFQDFEWLAVALFRRDLTDAEIRQLNLALVGVPI